MKYRDVKLAGIVQGPEEIAAVNRVLESDWHVSGPECNAFQKELAAKIGAKHCVVVNSGSSANLLALAALNLPKGSKVLTSACGFPATLNPILHLGYEPVFVDYSRFSLQISVQDTVKAIQDDPDIKCILLAHTLGSAVHLQPILDVCEEYDVKLIEDCCEALGAKYKQRYVGSYGDIGTFSFYSSHQISGLGAGGAIVTDDEEVYRKCKSLRDWGKMNVREGYITTELDTEVDGIPYDQQYTYKTIGYNMRLPDANCAYAREQLKRLDSFVTKRKLNYGTLDSLIHQLHIPILSMHMIKDIDPSPFGYPVITPQRDELVAFLEASGVHVRLFFAGNILRHTPYTHLSSQQEFPVADMLMRDAFFCGCWPGLETEDMAYIGMKIKEFYDV